MFSRWSSGDDTMRSGPVGVYGVISEEDHGGENYSSPDRM